MAAAAAATAAVVEEVRWRLRTRSLMEWVQRNAVFCILISHPPFDQHVPQHSCGQSSASGGVIVTSRTAHAPQEYILSQHT
jgi:hypothetical protein